MTFIDFKRLSYVPLVAPATSIPRLKSLASGADSFIYVVSRMGVTGSSAGGKMSTSLPELCARVKEYAGNKPIAVGFGVNTKEHFMSVGDMADGVVIGSKIINILKDSSPETAENAVRSFCTELSGPRAHQNENGLDYDIKGKVKIASVSGAVIPKSKPENSLVNNDLKAIQESSLRGQEQCNVN